jgi:hypothetical protein
MRDGRHALSIVAAALLLCATPRRAHASGGDPPPVPDFFEPSPAPRPPPPAPSPPATAIVEPPMPEPPSPRFGARGEVIVSGGSNIGVSSTKYTGSAVTGLDITFSPSVDYFIFKNVSVGLDLELEYTSAQGPDADGNLAQTNTAMTTGGPRLGVNVPFGSVASLWPRLALGVEWAHRVEFAVPSGSGTSSGSPPGPSTHLVGPYLSLFAPLVLQVRPHFFVGAGPSILHEFAPDGGPNLGGQRTTFGGDLVVGGYFGGDAPPSSSASSTPSPGRRFGEAHQVVVTNETGLGASFTSYAGIGTSVTSLSATVGVDYFAVDHVSIGIVLSGGYSRDVGPDATGVSATVTDKSFGAGVRLGGNLPLGPAVSLYPRATLSLVPAAEEEATLRTSTESTDIDAVLTISIPLLFHVARHFFVGFGPYVTHDLWRPFSSPNGPTMQIQGTTLGAAMLLGGWL